VNVCARIETFDCGSFGVATLARECVRKIGAANLACEFRRKIGAANLAREFGRKNRAWSLLKSLRERRIFFVA